VRIIYPNAYRLWSSLHRSNPSRLFLATQEQPHVGDQVPVELGLPGRDHPLKFSGTVVQRRGAGGRFPAGVYINLTPEQYQSCREYLGIGAVRSPLPPRHASGAAEAGTQPRRSVVVGDDDPDILGFLERALSRFSVDIIAVGDGASALRLIRELRPALVLLDVVMPEMDGTEVCRQLRAQESTAAIPVILVSALDPEELDAQADRAGANDCMAKPVDLGHLLNTVGDYLRE